MKLKDSIRRTYSKIVYSTKLENLKKMVGLIYTNDPQRLIKLKAVIKVDI